MKLYFLALLSLAGSIRLHASIVYENTTTDTFGTVFYSTGPYSEIGDQILLAGTDRQATGATAQFFNIGSGDGSFTATLSFYQAGGPVGAQIGSSIVTAGNAISSGGVTNVNFAIPNLILPGSVIFTLSVSSLVGNLDLGVNLFEPPGVGSSSNQFYIVNGGGFAQASQGNSQDNVYFSLNAIPSTAVPEPSTALLMVAGLAALACAGRRLRK